MFMDRGDTVFGTLTGGAGAQRVHDHVVLDRTAARGIAAADYRDWRAGKSAAGLRPRAPV